MYNRVGHLISVLLYNLLSLMKVCALLPVFVCVQGAARITQVRTDVLVILDTVGPIALLTLMNVNLHHAEMVSNVSSIS